MAADYRDAVTGRNPGLLGDFLDADTKAFSWQGNRKTSSF